MDAKVEMQKHLIDVAIRLLEKGYWHTKEDGITYKLNLSVPNIAFLYEFLRTEIRLEELLSGI
ncbi:hypothetical protein ACTJJ0_15720 [Chitinophaga sp. 22321]|uniref:Uncharacterized protein n=1 Tax=Chitinophaga hostae TaxID=2831022 RepID=A0ABS5J4I3_9BACT|nr:hypothetical protein [Chitinophaga hostae]MBS0029477.1 hypothetical protein [Chitinophaga hostae]